MPDFTLYVATIDVQFWNTMFNIVAMLSNQDSYIWGFAAFASVALLLRSQAIASVNSLNGQMGAALANNAPGALIPFVLAVALTTPSMQSKTYIESTTSGHLTVVDNVPAIISAIPSAASIVMHELQGFVRAAFLVAGSDYSEISARDNGFLNPLKVILTARSVVTRLGYVDTDVNAIVSSCLSADAGLDFGQINSLVLNAGNGGSGTSQGATLAQTLPINGVSGTSLGALLYQASLQTSTFVPDLNDGSGRILSCPDAVNVAINRINTTITSTDFSRVVVGSVNGMDDPSLTANYDITKLTNAYSAYRNANSVVAAATAGSVAAQAEMINLLMIDVVNNNLNCIKASSGDKTQCYAAMLQASEIERTNLIRIAEAVPMLQYAGAFFNQLLALVIVLGPIIIMFMMFTGQELGKCLKALLHILVWPMLAMGVGAEAVNGLLAVHTSNFLSSISHSGFLSHSQAAEVYRHFATEISTASSLMSSLPVLMSTLFALGGASALSHAVPKANVGESVGGNLSPHLSNQAPVVQKSSAATMAMGGDFGNYKFNGAMSAISASARYGDMVATAQSSHQEAIHREHAVSSGRSDLAAWRKAFDTGNYDAVHVDQQTGERVHKAYEENRRRSEATRVHSGNQAVKTNSNDASASVDAGVSAGSGGGEGSKPIKLGAGVSARGSTGAHDALTATQGSDKNNEIADSENLTKAISQEKADTKSKNHGHRNQTGLDKSLSTQKEFRENLTKSESSTDSYLNSVTASNGIVTAQHGMSNSEVAQQHASNPEFAKFNLMNGRSFEKLSGASGYIAQAQEQAETGQTDRLIGSPEAQKAALRLRAATLMAMDSKLPKEDRKTAAEYVMGAASAMSHINFNPGEIREIKNDLADPKNKTGINSDKLESEVDSKVPGQAKAKKSKPGSSGKTPSNSSGMVRPSPAPKPKTELEKLADGLKEKQTRGVTGVDIDSENKRQSKATQDAGLSGNNPDGTAVRTAKNVGHNLTDDPSRVSLQRKPQKVSGRVVDEK